MSEYLLETKWKRPEPLRVIQIKEGEKKFDVIQTKIGKEYVDFVFEPEEMLVTEVFTYFEDGSIMEKRAFADYTEINGIKMPQKRALISVNSKRKYQYYPINFRFNVEYNPRLFEPPFQLTPNAWKPQPN